LDVEDNVESISESAVKSKRTFEDGEETEEMAFAPDTREAQRSAKRSRGPDGNVIDRALPSSRHHGRPGHTHAACTQLREKNCTLVREVIRRIGARGVRRLVAETMRVQRSGGLMTADGARRRTPGGVFFHLLRDAMPPDEYRELMKADKKRKDARASKNVPNKTRARAARREANRAKARQAAPPGVTQASGRG